MTKSSKTKQPEIIIDTSTFFSALYNPWGNEALLFSLADNHFCFLHILDYVLQELREVFKIIKSRYQQELLRRRK